MVKQNRTPNINIFDNWNEISAYIFGFWLADGSINIYFDKRRSLTYKTVSFYNTEKELINKIGDVIGRKPTISNHSPGKKICWRVRVYSDKLFDFCYAITNSTNKSNQENPIPKIPKKHFHHFVRGFFDGDGSIHIKHYKTRHGKIINALQTSFTAGKDTGEFLNNLRDKLRKFIPVGYKKISIGVSKSLRFNQYDSMLLCNWMYKDATIYMERKKKVFDGCDKDRLLNSRKFFSNKV